MKRGPCKALLILFFFSLSFSIKLQAYDYFPTKAWKTKTLKEAGFQKEAFNNLLNYVWEDKGNHRTDAFVVIKDGYLIYEGYANGYTKTKRHMYWSLSKSLTSILMGVAIGKGILSFDTPISKYYPSVNGKKGKDLTLRSVLNMSSGFRFFEEHPTSIILSDSIYVYYSKKNFADVAGSIAKRKFSHRPDEQFNYGSHEPTLAMGVLKKAINNKKTYDDFPWVELFDKLGMKSIVIEQDKSGTFIGGTSGYGTAIDYAKLGLLLLNDGVWDGERILPEGYVDFATKTIAPALFRPESELGQRRLNIESYGAYFWLNRKLPMNKKIPYPSAPEDMYQAMGFRGQTMGVFPSQNMIIVRLGSDGRKPEKKIKRDKMYKLLMKSLKEVAK